MRKGVCLMALAATTLILSSCKDDEEPPQPVQNLIDTIPAFYQPAANADNYGKNQPNFTVIADFNDRIEEPWDLDFHPSRANELWVLNKGVDNTGGSTVTISRAGLPDQSNEWRRDGNAWHFMALPSALSFSKDNDNWATSAEILDANRQGGSFTGPSLWSSDMNIYARPSGGNGSHLDMLHASPYGMGIESDGENAFWLVDGHNGHLVWYDFNEDHGPGNDDHSDGQVRRYPEIELKREPGVASHMVKDNETGWLYIVDAGNKRILKVNTNTGTKRRDLDLINELLAEHSEYENVEWKIFASANLEAPAGIELSEGILYVSDNANGQIIAYDVETGFELDRLETGKKGIMGIKADKEGKLWFVSSSTHEVIRIDPN
ncbi:MAG: hypothetical protein JJ975_02510 [Bacteroidia bacterium]|nr:hypothetical protein [Bacteroidia bacterium]